MSRAVLLYLLLVVSPAGALGWFAFRVADSELARRLAEHRNDLERDVERLAGSVESALDDARKQALEDGAAAVGYARDGRWLGFIPPNQRGDRAEAEPSAEERQLFEISMRGGESFEHARRDPARALDAYAFYLPRIRSPALRARLRLGAARAAWAAGDKILGEPLLLELAKEPTHVDSEEGVPIALAAARLLGEPAPELERLWRSRRGLENFVAEHPELLASVDAVLAGESIVFVRKLEGGDREIRATSVSLPPLEAPDYIARLEPLSPSGEAPAAEDTVIRTVRLGADGPGVARVRLDDPRFEKKYLEASLQRDLLRGLVVLLVAVTLAGGVALTIYLTRERRLARLRAQLLANVSHELKTPVTSIRLFAEMLAEDGADPEQARRYGRHLSSEGQRLSQLVENLLDVSRLGRKEVELAREPVDVAALLRRIVEGFAFQAREKRVELSTEGLDASEVVAVTNAPAVERIVLNLLDNAVKYRRADGPSVRLHVEKSCDAVRIIVIDNGIGIPRRDQERIFEEFFRVRYDDYAVKGSGLGLSIARRLARKLGGDVTLESKEGAGSTFMLVLPARAPIGGEVDDARTHPDR